MSDRKFTKEVRQLMYGFGDVPNPAPDSVELMEDMLSDFIKDLCHTISKNVVGSKVKTSDILFALRHDAKKLARAKELLALEKELKQARSVFDIGEIGEAASLAKKAS